MLLSTLSLCANIHPEKMPTKPKPNLWYPDRSHFPTEQQFQAHKQTLDMLYKLHSDVNQKIEDLKKSIPSNIGQPAPMGAINSTILGIAVKPGIPADGQTLKYVKATNQWELS